MGHPSPFLIQAAEGSYGSKELTCAVAQVAQSRSGSANEVPFSQFESDLIDACSRREISIQELLKLLSTIGVPADGAIRSLCRVARNVRYDLGRQVLSLCGQDGALNGPQTYQENVYEAPNAPKAFVERTAPNPFVHYFGEIVGRRALSRLAVTDLCGGAGQDAFGYMELGVPHVRIVDSSRLALRRACQRIAEEEVGERISTHRCDVWQNIEKYCVGADALMFHSADHFLADSERLDMLQSVNRCSAPGTLVGQARKAFGCTHHEKLRIEGLSITRSDESEAVLGTDMARVFQTPDRNRYDNLTAGFQPIHQEFLQYPQYDKSGEQQEFDVSVWQTTG